MSELDNSGNKQLTQLERDQIPIENSALDGIIIFNKTTNQLERLRDRAWHPLIGDSASFLGLSDTPNSYVGKHGLALRVNAAETDVEFYDPSGLSNTFSIQVGNSANFDFDVVHPLNVKDVQVTVVESITGFKVQTGVDIIGIGLLNVAFSIPPGVNEFTVIITK